ncbi:alpha-1,3/1,6-mannosyltransferase ALG2-like isoform X2 [Panicum virgatum]|uniref:Alpha-1,3/1,6-mannosyltransferase ALG2 n=1 Tax=Panicum virgatum TaxID=38727 RepID=A0A8T0Q6V8_PANVG|nr:alpha-1,3/1,6-mannosyltransferase ALG2-like isoform X2 [Panicum virgatum]KAG2568362.1 hypothetical protein PVAP13_7NG312300 [Panicum virgatum]
MAAAGGGAGGSSPSGTRQRKLKVAVIHPDLGIGGAERLIVDAACQLAAHGHDVHVFTSHHDKNRCFEETVSGPFPVTVYGDFLPRHVFYRFHAVCAYLRCIFVALCVLLWWPSFDVILVDQVSVVIPLLKLKSSSKIVFYCHFPDLLLAQHSTMLRRLYRKPIDMIEEATTVVIPSTYIRLNFLSINRFERKKNLDLAISAFALLRSVASTLPGDALQDATLTVAGGYDKRLKENVDYLEELKRLAVTEGVSGQVKFVTSCSTSERNELLSNCLCVLYTPKDEHFGIVPLEAMAAHKPVIACNSGGPVETVVNEVTGFLCDPSPTEFSKAMLKLVNDHDLTVRMGKQARDHVVQKFSTKTFGDLLNSYILNAYHERME